MHSENLLLFVVEVDRVVVTLLDEGHLLARWHGEAELVVELGANLVKLEPVLQLQESKEGLTLTRLCQAVRSDRQCWQCGVIAYDSNPRDATREDVT